MTAEGTAMLISFKAKPSITNQYFRSRIWGGEGEREGEGEDVRFYKWPKMYGILCDCYILDSETFSLFVI